MHPGVRLRGDSKELGQIHKRSCHRVCICCKYPSPVNMEALSPLLDIYPDKRAAKILRDGFTHGFRLSYRGERVAREAPNLQSVIKNPERAMAKLEKEIELKRIAGPFADKPFENLIVSPIGLVPKSVPGKFRLIHHLSFPPGDSINDNIAPEACAVKYASFDMAVQLVASVGKGALMAKADVQSAFRLLPLHPDDFQLLGIKLLDQYFVDKALPMGASCSPALFETFSTFLEWAIKRAAASDKVTHYMDDMFMVGIADESSPSSCARLVSCTDKVCDDLGVPLEPDKAVGPASKITYLGLEIDSVKQVVAVPQDKLKAIRGKVEGALALTTITLRELQSVIGSLSFICKAVPPGRAFLRRLIDLTCGAKKPWLKIRLSSGAKKDLEMWLLFLTRFNGTAIFPEVTWAEGSDLELFTDASSELGFGGYFAGKWFQGRWPNASYTSFSIAWLEFFPILVAVIAWAEQLKGKKIIIRSDNMAVVSIINRQTSKCPKIMRLVRFFILQCLKVNLAFCAKHIIGKQNNIADSLSRFQMVRFREAAPAADLAATPVPQFVWNL